MNDQPPALPPLARDAHKGNVGRVLCFAGSRVMPGAAILLVRAAQRAGAGLVTLGVLDLDLLAIVAAASPETTYMDLSEPRELVAGRLPRAIDRHLHEARVAGPGMGGTGLARQLILRLLDAPFSGPLILDADALNLVAPRLDLIAASPALVVLTPHPREAARLLERPVGPEPADREACAQEIARRTRAICVLKGAGTVVSDGGRTWTNASGNPGMATAGSGDVLSGILAAYLADWAGRARQVSERESEGPPAARGFDVVCRAVYDHGRAGDLAAAALCERSVIASDLITHLGAAIGCSD